LTITIQREELLLSFQHIAGLCRRSGLNHAHHKNDNDNQHHQAH
jgi:hypothetical protein